MIRTIFAQFNKNLIGDPIEAGRIPRLISPIDTSSSRVIIKLFSNGQSINESRDEFRERCILVMQSEMDATAERRMR